MPSTKDQAEKPDKTEIDTQIVKTSPESTLESTRDPSFQAESIFSPEPLSEVVEEADPYDVMVDIGKSVTDSSNVSVFDNKDRSIDVINNIQLTPEVDWDWAMDVKAKEWATGFITRSYSSGLKIRYVLVTVSFIKTGRPVTRVGLGIKQAAKFTNEDWDSFQPTMLCSVLEDIQIGDNVDPSVPAFNPSNWAFAKNCGD